MSAYIQKLNDENDNDIYPITKARAVFMDKGTNCEDEINSKLTADRVIDTLQECISGAVAGGPAGSIAVRDIYQAFLDGCSRIAAAITANGVATSSNASPATMATNIGKIRTPIKQNTVFNDATKNRITKPTAYYDGLAVDYGPAYRLGQQSIMDQLTKGSYNMTEVCPADQGWDGHEYDRYYAGEGETHWWVNVCRVCGYETRDTNGYNTPRHTRTVSYSGYYSRGEITL